MATEHWDPDIRIEKVTSVLPTNVNRTGAHHDRLPDIGLSIRAFISTGAATEHAVVTEYSGEYIGHGQSKTVFKLHSHGGTFDGCILKITKKRTRFRALCLHASTRLWHHHKHLIPGARGRMQRTAWASDQLSLPLLDYRTSNSIG